MPGVSWFAFALDRLPELWLRTGEHLMLTGVSTGMAILIGVPLGILAARLRWLRSPLTGGVGIVQTIPSLAMLAILLALLQKIGAVPAIIALTLYALLPIVRNTLTGLEGVPAAVIEAARGIGMTPQQRLRIVELPLAMPTIVAGIRTAAVVSVGIATLSAFIGAGGLGQFINRGLALSNTNLILLGAIPAAMLALIVDGSIAAFQWGLGHRHSTPSRVKAAVDRVLRPVALAAPVGLIVAGFAIYATTGSSAEQPAALGDVAGGATVTVGAKNFTEQLILGEMMAQLIEGRTDLGVERKFNLGGTMICHGALESGGIDLYAEYTGTALTAILGDSAIADPEAAYDFVREQYRKRYAAEWLKPFGFNNTYAITVRDDEAKARHLETISDLAAISDQLRAGFTAEFSARPDGYPGLQRAYGLKFREVRDLEPGLMYQAIADSEVDVICAFATDGRIAAFKLHTLRDDRGFFPPYQAAPVVRTKTLKRHPELRRVLNSLGGRIDDTTMQRLNLAVDEGQQRPRDVAHEFLISQGLLPAAGS